MLRRFRRRADVPDEDLPARRHAVATLLVEIARADHDVDPSERVAITHMLSAAYGLDAESAAQLVMRAERTVEESVSLHEFTSRLNNELTREEKTEIIEMLWRVAFADGNLDKYEEHLVRKAADLLYVPHRHFIRAKLRSGRDPDPGPVSPAPSNR